MRVWVSGGRGQVGWELMRSAPAMVEFVTGTEQHVDVTDPDSVRAIFRREAPEIVIHAAAWTAVDAAEGDPERAFRVNRDGAACVAAEARAAGARMLLYSTDYVFGGQGDRPLGPTDRTSAVNVYGASKAAGELGAAEVLGDGLTILRTSWLYSAHGRNFVKTVLGRLRESGEVRVVDDQVGTPTWAASLARVTWDLLKCRERVIGGRTFHVADGGQATWFELARAVAELGALRGLIPGGSRVTPVGSEAWSSAAERPRFSVLDTTETWELLGYGPTPWREALGFMLDELADRRDE